MTDAIRWRTAQSVTALNPNIESRLTECPVSSATSLTRSAYSSRHVRRPNPRLLSAARQLETSRREVQLFREILGEKSQDRSRAYEGIEPSDDRVDKRQRLPAEMQQPLRSQSANAHGVEFLQKLLGSGTAARPAAASRVAQTNRQPQESQPEYPAGDKVRDRVSICGKPRPIETVFVA